MSKVAFTVSSSKVVTIFKDGKQHTIDVTHPNHAKVLERVKTNNFKNIEDLMNIGASIAKFTKGKVTVEGEQVKYGGEVVHNYVANRIVDLLKNGLPIEPLLLFLEKLMKNPSKASVDNLYRFLESNGHPILPNGDFVAYKRVRGDYKDIYSGTFDNSPGKVVSMPRNKVADNPQELCSSGLHAANLTYALNSYGTGPISNDGISQRLVVVSISPENVVSVPVDYNNAKLRTSEYTVLEDFTGEEWTQLQCFKGHSPVVELDIEDDDSWDSEEWDDENFYDDLDDDLDDDWDLNEIENEEEEEEEYCPTTKKSSSYKPTQKRDTCGRFCKNKTSRKK